MTANLKAYVRSVLHADLSEKPLPGANGVPLFYRKAYEFRDCAIGGVPFIAMRDRGTAGLTPSAIAGHCDFIRGKFGKNAVLILADITAHNRDRLIERGVPFIVPGRQTYLPFMAIHLSHIPKGDGRPQQTTVGRAAQIIAVGLLDRQLEQPLSIADAAKFAGYSRVSVIKAFGELEKTGAAARGGGRHGLSLIGDRKSAWDALKPFLANPCIRTVGLDEIPPALNAVPAGRSLLSAGTLLEDGATKTFAVNLSEFNAHAKIDAFPPEDAPVALQLWSYPPLLGTRTQIDPFSLYLTLKGDPDERVGIALDGMMEEIQW